MAHALKVCLDVDYGADSVVAACVGFVEWPDAAASFETTRRFEGSWRPATGASGSTSSVR